MKPINIEEIIIKPVFDTGSMQRGMSELTKKVRALKAEFEMLKSSIAFAAAPLLNLVLPAAEAMLGAFREIFDIAGAVFTVLFGTPSTGLEKAAAASNKLDESQKSLGKTTAKTAKAANKAMASFEELNVISRQAGSGAASAGKESGKAPDGPFNKWLERLAELLEPARAALARLKAELDRLGAFAYAGLVDFYESFLKPLGYWVLGEGLPRFIDAVTNGLSMIDWQAINDALHLLWVNLQPFAQSVGEGLLWLWETVLVPLGVWAVGTVLPEVITLLANAFAFVNEVIEAAKPALVYLWEEFLAPIAQWAGERLIEGLMWLNERLIALSDWVALHKEEVADFVRIVGMLAAGFLAAKLSGELLGGAMNVLKNILGFLCSPAGVLMLVIGLVAGITTAAGNAGEMIESLKAGFKAFGEFISGVFTGNWERAWTGIKDIFKNILNGMVIIFESVINLIVDGINHLVSKVNAIEIKVPSWVPGLGGKGWSPGIPSIPHCSLPRLASGAVIPPKAEFLAVLGDQRNGRNLEAPENLIRQIVREESGGGGDGELLPLVVELDGGVLYRSMEKVRRDRGAVIGGAFANAY